MTIKTVSTVESRKYNPEIPEKQVVDFCIKIIVVIITVSQCISLFFTVIVIITCNPLCGNQSMERSHFQN